MTDEAKIEAIEKYVTVCPQCEGEGGYADGLDEASCRTECTRCGSNGWIVDARAVLPIATEGMVPRAVPDDVAGLVERLDRYSPKINPTVADGAAALTSLASTNADLERQLAEAREAVERKSSE